MPPPPKSHENLEHKLVVREKLIKSKALQVWRGPKEKLSSTGSGEVHVDYQKRVTKRSVLKAPHLKAGAQRARIRNISKRLPPLPQSRFGTFEEFDDVWGQYVVNHLTKYSVSTSCSRQRYNNEQTILYEARKAAVQKAGKAFTEELTLLPEHLTHKFSTKVCCHGRQQPSRGKGLRVGQRSSFTACPATIKAVAIEDEDGRWIVEVQNENTTHNHSIDEDTFETYLNSSHIPEGTLRSTAEAMIASGGEMRRMLDLLNRGRRFGKFTRRKLTNFREYRLGGLDALLSSNRIVRKFLALHGSKGLLIKDQNGSTCGLVFQTRIQRELFRRYGDSLILDWTHNTNNRGFHLGSLLVTTATGMGVSVLDFLCVSQTKDAMRAILSDFIVNNPTATTQLKSVVIDKDYKEWAVLNELLPHAEVVLCQFHVLKWFKHVVNQPKYNLNHALRPAVIKILRALVYAPDDHEFVHQQFVLADLLSSPAHADFLEYMNARWYNCVPMWSNCQRGNIFTATNTTSNRLESFWKQLKDSLRQRLRMDVCIEAIFLYATSVVSREKEHLQQHKTSMATHPLCNEYIRPLLEDLSDYACRLVTIQWNKFAAAPSGSYGFAPVSSTTSNKYKIHVSGPRHVEVDVDTVSWTCSCHFNRGCLLPCRHLFYAAVVIEQKLVYPPASVPSRWSLSAALDLLPGMSEAIDGLSTLRLDLIGSPRSSNNDSHAAVLRNDGDADAGGEEEVELSRYSWPNFAHYEIQRSEASDCVVFNDIEKRNVVENLLQELLAFLMGQGTARFTAYAVELGQILAELLQRWKSERLEPLPNEDATDEVNELQDREATMTAAASDSEPGWHEVGWVEDEVVFEEDLPVVTPVDQPGLMSFYADVQVASSPFSPPGDAFSAVLGDINLWQTAPFSDMDADLLEKEMETNDTSPTSLQGDEQGQQEGVLVNASPVCYHDWLDEETKVNDSSRAAPRRNEERGRGAELAGASSMSHDLQTSSLHQMPTLKRKEPDVEFTLPDVVRNGNLKQTGQAASVTGRTVYLKQDASCPVLIDKFVLMAKHKSLPVARALIDQFGVEFTDPSLQSKAAVAKLFILDPARQRLSFAISDPVLKSLQVAVKEQESRDKGQSCFRGSRQYVARLVGCGDSRDFSEDDIQDVVEFRDTATALEAYVHDKQWVESDLRWQGSDQRQWGRIIELGFPQSVAVMRSEVLAFLNTATLSTVLSFPRSTIHSLQSTDNQRRSALATAPTITVRDVMGSVARHVWLNDAVMNYALKRLATRYRGVVIVDSLQRAKTIVPSASVMSTRVVVFPINYDNAHWCVVCVRFDWVSERHEVFLYDPTCSSTWTTKLWTTWSSWCLPLLKEWCERDNRLLNAALDAAWGVSPQVKLGDITEFFVKSPRQTDGFNCGVFCILRSCAFMSNEDDITRFPELAPAHLSLLRLRLLWLLLCASSNSTSSTRVEEATRTEICFTRYYEACQRAAKAPRPKKPKGTVTKALSFDGILL